MPEHRVVSREEWLIARKRLLAEEKALTQQRERVAASRRALPWVALTEDYRFEGESGPVTLRALFGPHSQLVIQHFMFDPDWEVGCKSCSFWADSHERARVHLAARDVSLAVVSRAPLGKLLAFRERMGWTFPWVSSHGNTFNQDFDVSFPQEPGGSERIYNYVPSDVQGELPGISVFAREGDTVYHTYSCYARGLDPMNVTYQYLDLVPKGRDEADLAWSMEWVRLRDRYQTS